VAGAATGTAVPSPEGGEAVTELLHLRDAGVERRDLLGQKLVELRQQLVAAARVGRRHQPADLGEREPEAARLLRKAQAAFGFRVVETVAGRTPSPRADQTNAVVVADGAGRQADALRDLLDGEHDGIVDLSPKCQVKASSRVATSELPGSPGSA
jgi:hypothetical protein